MNFIRTTHDEQGQWRPLMPAAWQFWQREGGVAVQHLPEAGGLTLAEVVEIRLFGRQKAKRKQTDLSRTLGTLR
jgi:hypothetical protein